MIKTILNNLKLKLNLNNEHSLQNRGSISPNVDSVAHSPASTTVRTEAVSGINDTIPVEVEVQKARTIAEIREYLRGDDIDISKISSYKGEVTPKMINKLRYVFSEDSGDEDLSFEDSCWESPSLREFEWDRISEYLSIIMTRITSSVNKNLEIFRVFKLHFSEITQEGSRFYTARNIYSPLDTVENFYEQLPITSYFYQVVANSVYGLIIPVGLTLITFLVIWFTGFFLINKYFFHKPGFDKNFLCILDLFINRHTVYEIGALEPKDLFLSQIIESYFKRFLVRWPYIPVRFLKTAARLLNVDFNKVRRRNCYQNWYIPNTGRAAVNASLYKIKYGGMVQKSHVMRITKLNKQRAVNTRRGLMCVYDFSRIPKVILVKYTTVKYRQRMLKIAGRPDLARQCRW